MAKGKTGVTQKKGTLPVALDVPVKPAGTAPDVPPNFQPLDAAQTQGLRKPTAEQVSQAPAVVVEISASTTYAADFGPKAIPPATFAADSGTAHAWQQEAARALRWYQYAHQMQGQAWNRLLGEHDTFEKDYDTALLHDATIAERYPATTVFVGSRSTAAKRAAATRRRRRRPRPRPRRRARRRRSPRRRPRPRRRRRRSPRPRPRRRRGASPPPPGHRSKTRRAHRSPCRSPRRCSGRPCRPSRSTSP